MNIIRELESINIKGLAIEEPRKTLDLDPEHLITEEFWAEIKSFLEDFAPNEVSIDRIEVASQIKLIAPNRFSTLNLGGYLKMIQSQLNGLRLLPTEESTSGILGYMAYFRLAAAALQLFGRKTLNIEIAEAEKKRFKEIVKREGSILSTINFRVVYPKELAESFASDEYWQKEKGYIEEVREKKLWGYLAYAAASARLVSPERFAEINLNEKELQNILYAVGDAMSMDLFVSFADFAWSLKILTADEVRVTDNGIELIKHPSPLPEIQTLPEIRRF